MPNINNYDSVLDKRGPEDLWIRFNPILKSGEVAYVTDRFMTKHGDGKSSFKDLPYDGVYNIPSVILSSDISDKTYRVGDTFTTKFKVTITGIALSLIDTIELEINDPKGYINKQQDLTLSKSEESTTAIYVYETDDIELNFNSIGCIEIKAIVKKYTGESNISNLIRCDITSPVYSKPIDLTITNITSDIIKDSTSKFITDGKGILFAYPSDYGDIQKIFDDNGLNLINDFVKKNNVTIDNIDYNVYIFNNPISGINNFNIIYQF